MINPNSCGAEGFQRAIGKPFGRLRRGEIPYFVGNAKYLRALSQEMPRTISPRMS